MVMPRWVARLNRSVMNPRALEQGTWPVLHHTGRVSGRAYRTPIGAYRVEDGYLVNIVYGRSTDWLRNVLAAGGCALEIDGELVPLERPRIVHLDEVEHLGATRGHLERTLRITEALHLTSRSHPTQPPHPLPRPSDFAPRPRG